MSEIVRGMARMRLIDLDEFLRENCISRIEGESCEGCNFTLEVSCKRLLAQPTIDPVNLPSAKDKDVPGKKVGKWIPVSERLPGYGEQVVVNFRNEQISRNRIGVSYCYVQKEGFFSDVPFEYKVVAWMPLPDPWKEEEG